MTNEEFAALMATVPTLTALTTSLSPPESAHLSRAGVARQELRELLERVRIQSAIDTQIRATQAVMLGRKCSACGSTSLVAATIEETEEVLRGR